MNVNTDSRKNVSTTRSSLVIDIVMLCLIHNLGSKFILLAFDVASYELLTLRAVIGLFFSINKIRRTKSLPFFILA